MKLGKRTERRHVEQGRDQSPMEEDFPGGQWLRFYTSKARARVQSLAGD